ncbi:MAG: tetratricopeptide repeat protein [Candidatus Melainabacteria bacterium]|nr:tetratricopeptide repeat protein [Candidatus Melainabacteria bacterium]
MKFAKFFVVSLLLPVLWQPVFADGGIDHAYERGRKNMTRGDLTGAINAFSEAISANNQNGIAYLRRGECNYRLNNFSEAKKDFDRAIEIAPNSASAFIWRGTLNGRNGDETASIDDYKKAIGLNQELAFNYFKSKANQKGGVSQKNEGCVRYYKAAMDALYPNGYTEDLSTLGDYKEPLTDPNWLSEVKGSEQVVPRREIAGVFPGADEYHGPDAKASLAALNEQIRGDSTNSAYFYQRAKVFQKLMKVDNAIRDYDTAISLEPNRAQYYVGKASLFFQLNKPMKVDSILQKARSVDPTVPHKIKFAVEPYPATFKWTGND